MNNNLNLDIEYNLNDTTAYGIYNGIAEFKIREIIFDIQKQLNCSFYISPEDMAKLLSNDEEIKKIAIETYQPNPERKQWNDEYLAWFREAAKEKKAPGYGIIPNTVIRQKITDIIKKEMVRKEENNQKETERVNRLFKLAKETGEKQLINKWTEDCNNKHLECNLDICCLWAMPDGTEETTRTHTY